MDSLSSCLWWVGRGAVPGGGDLLSWGRPSLPPRPTSQSGPSSPPGTRLSKEEGAPLRVRVESCGRRVCRPRSPTRGEALRFSQPRPRLVSCRRGPGLLGSLKPDPRVSFGFSFLWFEVGFCFSVFCMYLVQCCQGGASGFTTAAGAGVPGRVSV